MIFFAADGHYGARPGWNAYECLKKSFPDMVFTENDWKPFTALNLARDCDLVILSLIAGTNDVPPPGDAEAASLKAYCETGKPLLLHHGGSAAMWQYPWFREMVGFRWVRPNDPDNVEKSVHPKEPFTVRPAKTRHPLAKSLKEMDLPHDEIYTALEQTQPLWILMETQIPEGIFPQCVEAIGPWKNRIVSFLPGHGAGVTRDPVFIENFTLIIKDLLKK